VDGSRLGSAIAGGNLDQDIFGSSLGIFHIDVEITVLVEDSGVQQFVFYLVPGTLAISFDQSGPGGSCRLYAGANVHERITTQITE